MTEVFLSREFSTVYFPFFFPSSRHLAVGLKREQKRDHISAQHHGEVLINSKRWEVLHSGAFQVLICPRHFFNPYLESRKLHLFPPLCCFWNRFYLQNKSCFESGCYLMPVLFPLCPQHCVGCEGVARVSAEERGCRCLPVFLFRVTLAGTFLFFDAALLKGAKYKSVC